MWVARDKNGEVQLFTATKPHRVKRLGEEYWDTDGLCDCECYIPDIFPNLKWEDEPIEVELEEVSRIYCDYCHTSFTYKESDIVDASRPEAEDFYMYVECPKCGTKFRV